MPEAPHFTDAASNLSMPAATVIPVLQYPDVPAASAWLCQAFGFVERLRIGEHRVQLCVGAGAVVLAQGELDLSAGELAAASVMVRVSSVDAHCRLATQGGARVLAEPTTQPYGERQYSVADLVGRTWTFSETVADVHPGTWGGVMARGCPGAP